MRLGSICSGIGGLELGLERAGLGETVWQAEIDPHASEVLARHWDVPNLGSVKQSFTDAPPVDLICAGYPCQPFSTAGRRQGTEDDRHLWPFVRDAIRDLGPSLVVLENVRGHLSLGFGDVLGDLADLGFDASWRLLRASDVGAPHQRARLFVAAYARSSGPTTADPTGQRTSDAITGVGSADHRLGERSESSRHRGATPDAQVERGERDGRPRDGRARLADASGLAPAHPDGAGVEARCPDPLRAGEVQGGGSGRLQQPVGGDPDAVRWGPYGPAIERWEAIHGPAPAPTVDGRLSPAFVEWMMGFPEGWVDGLTRPAALRCLGNAVVPQVAEMVGRMVLGSGGGAVSPLDVLLPTPTSQCMDDRTHSGGNPTVAGAILGIPEKDRIRHEKAGRRVPNVSQVLA